MTINNVFIVSAVRTPVGQYMGSLNTVAAYDLAALADILLIQKKIRDSSNGYPLKKGRGGMNENIFKAKGFF